MMLSKCYSSTKFRVFSAAIIGVVFGLSGWVASTGVVLAQNFAAINPVKLVPQEVEGELILKVEKDNQCRRNMHEGCLLFRRGESGFIVFHLPGSKNKVKDCSDAETEHVITKIEVTAQGADEGDDMYKGDFNGPFPLPLWLKENAFEALDLDTGIIYSATSPEFARTREMVSNLNNHESLANATEFTRSFWYRVTVTACAENDGVHAVWVSDPRGDNEGRR